MPLTEIARYLEEHRDAHVVRIQELVRQPSVSTERRGGRAFAELLRDHYLAIGCSEAQVVETGDDWPGVWGFLDAGAEQTIASYSYFDTYGVDESAWEHDPFGAELTARDGFPQVLVGRGAGVKGSHQAWLNALEAIAAVEGRLPVNVLLLSEGCEMVGSPNFERITESAAGPLARVDAFLSPRIGESPASNVIAVNLGYKNMVTFDLRCTGAGWGGPAHGLIYGNSKSIVDAPTHRLVQALATLIGEDGNTIAIDGLDHLNDERKDIGPEERRLVDDLVRRFDGASWSDVLPTAGGVDRFARGLDGPEVLYEYLYAPSINISEMRTAGVGDPVRLTMLLPDEAIASVELRMVTDLPAEEILACVRRHLDARGFEEVELIPYGRWDGHQQAPDHPLVEAAVTTLERYGREPVLWPIQPFGGPWAHVPRRLGVPALGNVGLGHSANGGGSPNEYLVIESDGRVASLVEAETYFADLLLTYASLASNGVAAAPQAAETA